MFHFELYMFIVMAQPLQMNDLWKDPFPRQTLVIFTRTYFQAILVINQACVFAKMARINPAPQPAPMATSAQAPKPVLAANGEPVSQMRHVLNAPMEKKDHARLQIAPTAHKPALPDSGAVVHVLPARTAVGKTAHVRLVTGHGSLH